MAEWGNVRGSQFNFRYSIEENSDGEAHIGDLKNEIIMTNELTDSTAARCDKWIIWDPIRGKTIVEADMYIDNDVLSNADYLSSTVLHELGHCLGLEHSLDYAYMLQGGYDSGTPHSNHSPNAVYPVVDDREGIRAIYSSTGLENDWAISNIYPDLGVGALNYFPDPSPSSPVCPGDNFEVYNSILNNGTQVSNVKINYYLSEDETINTSDTLIKTAHVYQEPESDYIFSTYLEIPEGTKVQRIGYPEVYFYFGAIVDPDNDITERLEGNNKITFGRVQIDTAKACWLREKYGNTTFNVEQPRRSRMFSEYIMLAHAIAEGTVNSISSVIPEDNTAIYSYHDMSIHYTFAGNQSNNLNIRQLGGSIGNEEEGKTLRISHAPLLEEGQRYIMFIGQNNHSQVPFIGGQNGVLRIINHEIYGDIVQTYNGLTFMSYNPEYNDFILDFIEQPIEKATAVDDEGHDVTIPYPAASITPMSAKDFRDALRQHIEKIGFEQKPNYEEIPPTSTVRESDIINHETSLF